MGGGDRAVAAVRSRGQAQGNDNYRVPFGKLRRRSITPSGSAPPSCAPCSDDYRPFDRLRRRALHGPDREVYFPQEHPPGREAQFDFTHCTSLGVTIAGRPFPHLLFQLIFSHSGWRYDEVPPVRLFWRCSRDCRLHCGPWAAYRRWCAATIPRPPLTRCAAAIVHTSDDYALFVARMVHRRNRLVQGKLEQELACLRPLPPVPMPKYINYRARVRKWSTIQVAGRTYTVPSRLIGKNA